MNRSIVSLASLLSVCGIVSPSFATTGDSQSQAVIAPEISEINNLQHLIADAVNEVREINYIVVGDSTKDGRNEQTKQYYADILSQLNIQYVDNSVGGLDASEWISGVDSQHGYNINETVAQAISQTPGLGDNKGENTILEFSLGINDYFRDSNLPEATLLETIKQGLDIYISACPKTEIILVTPIHFHVLHSTKLNNIYVDLSAHYGFKLIDVEAVTKPVYHTNNFYIDYVHPSAGGARRVVNYILNEIVPDQYSSSVTLPEYIPLEGGDNSIELTSGLTPVAGHYDVNTGDRYESTWQRLPQFEVIPNRELTMVSTGSRRGILFLDANEVIIGESEAFHNSPSDSTLRVQIPPNAKYARVNVHNGPSVVDVSIKYSETPLQHMTIAEINQGLNIKFNTASEAIAPLIIADNEWNQISLPLLPPAGQNTVEAVFADDISGIYGEDWALFAYDANNNQYFSPDLGDTVAIGTGYWIIQATGEDVTIDLPERSTYPSLVYSAQCPSINGCFEVALATQTDDNQWSMLGHSFTQQTNWNDLRVTTTGNACNGCTVNEAESTNVFHNQAWHYNPATNQYELIENTMELNSWDGFWGLTLSNAEGTNPKLLIPNQ